MKSKHLFKIIIGSSLSLVAIAPTLTLTSCAKISQYTMPIMTGGTTTEDGIFADIPIEETAKTDPDGVAFDNYLPTQFDTYIDSSTGGQPNAYVYAKPDDVKDFADGADHSTMTQYDSGWYNYADSKLAPNKDGKNSILSYKNLNIADLASSTSSIVYNLTSLINSMLSFVKQPAILTNTDTFNKWMETMFTYDGNTFFGSDGDHAKRVMFYSFFFSLLNILDEGKQGIKFDISSSDFKLQSWAYGPGQFIDSSHINADPQVQTEDNQFCMTENVNVADPQSPPTRHGASTDAYVTVTKNTDINPKYVPTSMPYGIPTLFNLGATKYAYFNPLDKHSYDQRDWLINDINVVKNRVQSSGEWNAMSRLTGQTDKTQWVPSLTYTVNPTRFSGDAGFDSNIADIKNTSTFGGKLEPAWDYVMNASNPLAPNTFFAMSHYGVASYKTTEGDISSLTIRNPVFSYISSVFPTYILYKDDGVTIDDSIFTQQYPAYELGNKDWKIDDDKLWYFDETKANQKMVNVINYLRTNIHPNQIPPIDAHSIYCLKLFQRIFGNYDDVDVDPVQATGPTGWINIPDNS